MVGKFIKPWMSPKALGLCSQPPQNVLNREIIHFQSSGKSK